MCPFIPDVSNAVPRGLSHVRSHAQVGDIESDLIRDSRQGRTTDRIRQGPLPLPHRLCTAADQARRTFASRGLCGVSASRDGLQWTARLALDGGHRCLDGRSGRQQAIWVAEPQHPGDCVSGYYRPAYAGACAADGDPVQRRKALGSKEIQAAQIKDQPAAK
jgi:hypothetical protein